MDSNNSLGKCSVCLTECTKFCSACRKVYYCSQAHQKSDRKLHKSECYPALLLTDESQGRHFVATTDLRPGDLIFKDQAVVSGPSGAELHFYKICLGCYKIVKGDRVCSKCKWPVCDALCEKVSDHSDFECQVFSKAKVLPELFSRPVEYDFIKYLRTLLLKDASPKKWEQILNLASHVVARSANKRATFEALAAFEFINLICQLKQFDFETVNHVVGVWGVNSFGANPPSGPEPSSRLVSFLFPKTSLASHSCIANTRGILRESLTTKSSSPCFQMELLASLPIKSGERILITYADVCEGTWERRQVLFDNYFFACSCTRCQDPSEFGTCFSALICQICRKGSLLPLDSLDPTSIWQCRHKPCASQISHECLASQVASVKERLNKITGENLECAQKLEALLEEFQGKTFHQNNWLMIDIEYRLMQHLVLLVSKSSSFVRRLEEISLHCLAVANLIQPGHNSYRGEWEGYLIILNDFGKAVKPKILFSLAQAKYQALLNRTIHTDVFLQKQEIDSIFKYAMEARDILSAEPEGSEAWKIVAILNRNMKQLEKMGSLIKANTRFT